MALYAAFAGFEKVLFEEWHFDCESAVFHPVSRPTY